MISYATHEEEVEEVEKGKSFVCVSAELILTATFDIILHAEYFLVVMLVLYI